MYTVASVDAVFGVEPLEGRHVQALAEAIEGHRHLFLR